jgi:hypothetical protein
MLRRPPTRIELKAEDKDEVRTMWIIRFSRDERERERDRRFKVSLRLTMMIFENDSTV